MDFRSSFRAPGEKMFTGGLGAAAAGASGGTHTGMFKALRRLHGQNLESKGLNDLSEAFQSFVTRARFFSVGKLRRTWSHSAVEFMKYRRLLPMLLADGQDFDGETDDFDAALTFQAASRDERKVVVTNVSPRVTASQLQAFFTQFGKITSCVLPREEMNRRHSSFATLPRQTKTCGVATITFKKTEDARKARDATPETLKFYDQVMVVKEFSSSRKGGKGLVLADDSKSTDEGRLSRASSTNSLASSLASTSIDLISLDDLPDAALCRVLAFLPVTDTVRLERVNKKWMEAAVKSWSLINHLSFTREVDGVSKGFGKHYPLRNSHLRAILRRAGAHLRGLDLSGCVHLLDDKALQHVGNLCPALRSLDLSGVGASWQALQELSEALPQMERLAYRDMHTLNDKAAWFLVKGCAHSLRHLDLRGCRRIRGRCFKLLGTQLQQLYLDGCVHVESVSVEDLCTGATELKELRLNECYGVTDMNISMISRTMPDLESLTLCGDKFEKVTSSGLAHMSRLEKLHELAFDYNPLVSDEVLQRICCGCRQLKVLSLANAGSDQLITSNGLEHIAQLTELEQLDLSWLAAVRSSSLLHIVFSCRKIELLQLRNCVYLSDDGVSGLSICEHLRHVDLSGSILVSSSAVQEFIKAFPHGEDEKSPSPEPLSAKNAKKTTITLVVGGTACDASQLRVRGSRVAVDFSDYSALVAMGGSQTGFRIGSPDDDDSEDDEFEALTAQRSFYIDAVCGEEESPLENEKDVLEWAEREARNLGLIKQ